MDLDKLNLKLDCQSAPPMKLQLNAQTLEFNSMCNQYEFWFNDHDSFPSLESLDDDEKQLAMWCDKIRILNKARKKTVTQYQIDKLDSLTYWYWNKTDIIGVYRLLEFKQWYHLHQRFPQRYADNEKEKSLYSWYGTQRQFYKKDRLTPGRIHGLESVPGWTWNGIEEEIDYDEFIAELNEWYNTYKILPSHGKDLKENTLAIKCDLIRRNINQLESQQIERLNELPYWRWDNLRIHHFIDRYKDLKCWLDKHDNYPSSVAKDDYERELGGWVKTQRNLYRQNKLTTEQVNQLDKLKDWSWDGNEGKDVRQFDSKYDDLVKFVSSNHYLPRFCSKDISERRFADWCSSHRKYYRLGQLDPERIKKLDAIEEWYWNEDFIIDTRPFDIKCEEIMVWMETHETLPYEDNPDQLIRQMGRFCGIMRKSHRNGTLSQDKINKLEQIYNWWWPDNIIQYQPFEIVAEELHQWVNQYNYIPSKSATDPLEKYFGNWCERRRKEYRGGTLSVNLISQLEAIPNWYWNYVRKMHSDISLTWLNMISVTYPDLQTVLSSEGEFGVPNTNYHVDGYDPITNTIFEFYGDYWHGNPKLSNTITDPKAREVAQSRFLKTQQRKQILISMGYNYVDIWEDSWKMAIKLLSRAKITRKQKKKSIFISKEK
jgi:hypothetical protein